MHYYQHHIGDFIKDTANLSDHQLATYMRMLWAYYDSEKPISGELEDIAFAMRSDEKTVQLLLRHYFKECTEGWSHARCDREIAEYRSKSESAKKGAKARWINANAKVKHTDCNADAMRTHIGSNSGATHLDANQEPITTNQEPINTIPKGMGGKPPQMTDPNEIIFGYGLALLTNAGTAEKQARSFLGGLRKHHGDDILIDKLRECAKARPLQPLEWLAAALPPGGTLQKLNKQEALEASNAAVAERFLRSGGYVP